MWSWSLVGIYKLLRGLVYFPGFRATEGPKPERGEQLPHTELRCKSTKLIRNFFSPQYQEQEKVVEMRSKIICCKLSGRWKE